jgi:hypothetical protein
MNCVTSQVVFFRKRSADAYIRGLSRRVRRARERHVVITACDLRTDGGIRTCLARVAQATRLFRPATRRTDC